MSQWLAVMLGGAVGALLRYWISSATYLWLGKNFPYGTLAVNAIGSLAMGILVVFLVEKWQVAEAIRLMLIVGLLGAFTTFSTFSLDTYSLIIDGQMLKAFLNIAANIGICLIALWIGIIFARQF